MKRCSLKHGVLFWVLILRLARTCWTWTLKVASQFARTIFFPPRNLRFRTRGIETSARVERLRYLAWLAQRQYRLARQFGSLAEGLLANGRKKTARRVARGAFLHWRYSRKADLSFRAERDSARHSVVA